MSLITQCPACSTMFRVVPDQLRISEGWVRCGQCDEVFDANAHLQAPEVPAPSPPVPWSVPAAAPVTAGPSLQVPLRAEPEPVAAYDWGPVLTPPAAMDPAVSHDKDESSGLEDFDPLQPHEQLMAVPLSREAPAALSYNPETDPFLEQSPHDFPVPEEVPVSPDALGTAGAWGHAMETALERSGNQAVDKDSEVAEQAPLSFMSGNESQHGSRRWLGIHKMAWLCVLLVLMLPAQFLVLERDHVAATVPALRPMLLWGCELLSCSITAPRQIEAIAIESSTFTSIKPGVYMLGVSLKNAASIALAAPALELTLTDVHDQALVRRVLLAKDFSDKAQIAAGFEFSTTVPISVQMGAENQKVAGYKLLVFYP